MRTTVRERRGALWSGSAAFFGSLLPVGTFDVVDADQWAEYLGAFLTAGITAAVYSRERLDAARKAEPPCPGLRPCASLGATGRPARPSAY